MLTFLINALTDLDLAANEQSNDSKGEASSFLGDSLQASSSASSFINAVLVQL